MKESYLKLFVSYEIRIHAHRSGLRPERSALDHSAKLTSMIKFSYLYIIHKLMPCLFVCLFPNLSQSAEPIKSSNFPKWPGMVLGHTNRNLSAIKIHFSKNYLSKNLEISVII